MIPRSLFNKTALRKRAVETGTDRRNHPQVEWTDELEFPVALQPQSGREVYDGQKVVVSQYRAYADAGTDIRAKDRVFIDGFEYNVIWAADAAGRGHHVEIDLVFTGNRDG